jgi:hypothetical protein
MLTPLYPVSRAPATITVVAPGALAGALSVPIAPLETALPVGFILHFGTNKFAKLSAARAVSATSLATVAIPTALTAGDEATVAGARASVLLAQKFTAKDEAEQVAVNLVAEQLLDLRAPAYTGDAAEELAFAVVLQINYWLARSDEPLVKKAIAQGGTAISTTFRDRWVNPDAAAIVARVTGRQPVRFTVPPAGV